MHLNIMIKKIFYRINIPVLIFIGSIFIVNAQTPLYLDSSLSTEQRVEDLMSYMTLEEKVYQMNQFVGLDHMREAEKNLTEEELHSNDAQGFYKGIFSEDVAEMTRRGEIGSFLHVLSPEESNLLQDLAAQSRLKIPLLIGIDAIHGNALVSGTTVYPSPIALASTWSDNFLEIIGKQTAVEMRATGSHWTFTPNIDVLRDPRWGRVGETFGEDHLLVGNLGAAMIRGFQQDDFTGTEKVIACAKHMIAGGESINGLNAAPMAGGEEIDRRWEVAMSEAKEEKVDTSVPATNFQRDLLVRQFLQPRSVDISEVEAKRSNRLKSMRQKMLEISIAEKNDSLSRLQQREKRHRFTKIETFSQQAVDAASKAALDSRSTNELLSNLQLISHKPS